MNKLLVERFLNVMEEIKKNVFRKNDLSRSELTKGEFTLLNIIKQFERDRDSFTTADLSDRLNITKPAISQMLNLLEDKNLIERKINRDDKRLMMVSLTEHGKTVIEKETAVYINRISEVMDMMGEEDCKTFIDLMEKYLSKVKEYRKQQQ